MIQPWRLDGWCGLKLVKINIDCFHEYVPVSPTWINGIQPTSIILHIPWLWFRIIYMNLQKSTVIHCFIYTTTMFPYPLHISTKIYWHPFFMYMLNMFMYPPHESTIFDWHPLLYIYLWPYMTLFPYPLHESTIIYWHLLFYVYHEHVLYIVVHTPWPCIRILYMNLRKSTDIHFLCIC